MDDFNSTEIATITIEASNISPTETVQKNSPKQTDVSTLLLADSSRVQPPSSFALPPLASTASGASVEQKVFIQSEGPQVANNATCRIAGCLLECFDAIEGTASKAYCKTHWDAVGSLKKLPPPPPAHSPSNNSLIPAENIALTQQKQVLSPSKSSSLSCSMSPSQTKMSKMTLTLSKKIKPLSTLPPEVLLFRALRYSNDGSDTAIVISTGDILQQGSLRLLVIGFGLVDKPSTQIFVTGTYVSIF